MLHRSGDGGWDDRRVAGPVPNNSTRFCAERAWDVVTKAKLGTKDEKAGKGSIAGVNKSREGICGSCIDRERLSLKYHPNCAIEESEGDIDQGDS